MPIGKSHSQSGIVRNRIVFKNIQGRLRAYRRKGGEEGVVVRCGVQLSRDDPFLNVRLGAGNALPRGGSGQQPSVGGAFFHEVKNQRLCPRNIHESAEGYGGQGGITDIFIEQLSVGRFRDLTEQVQQKSLVVAVASSLDGLGEAFADLVNAHRVGRSVACETREGIFVKIVPHAFAGGLHHPGHGCGSCCREIRHLGVEVRGVVRRHGREHISHNCFDGSLSCVLGAQSQSGRKE